MGLDLPSSPEVDARARADAEFVTFDGERLPFGDGEFELVFCKQVLEHVRRPEPLLAEVARVLEPGGHFVGSTSQLEPYHSLSVTNFTPYGLARLMGENGACRSSSCGPTSTGWRWSCAAACACTAGSTAGGCTSRRSTA